MSKPTQKQVDLLMRRNVAWAIVSKDGTLLEIFASESSARAKMLRIASIGRCDNYHVKAIVWHFAGNDIIEARRAMEEYMRGPLADHLSLES